MSSTKPLGVFGISKHSLLKTFDGSARRPRDLQVQALSWLADNWSSPGLVLQLPTGVGKSAIARAIQLQTGCAILTPNNALLDQYGDSYPELNTLKGAAHYPCSIGGDHEDCEDCGYAKARTRAKKEPTIYNPLSYLYNGADTSTVVIDEAHKFEEMMRLLISYKFSAIKYQPPKDADGNWVLKKAAEYNALGSLYRERKDIKKAAKAFQQGRRLSELGSLFVSRPEDFVHYFEDDGTFVVEPLEVPRTVFERALGKAKRVVLLSATIPPSWAKNVLGNRNFKYLDLPSPIPKENRRIVFDAAGLKASSDPANVAIWIKRQLERYEGNAIVHVTYSLGKQLSQFFPDAHIHTKETKQKTLRDFKKSGGLWIAAGASEGVDLVGDSARVNLIPILPFANNREPLGAALFERNPYNYYLETAIQFVQQCGRTTRGVDDRSTTVVGDNRLSWLLKKCEKELPKSFKEAILWR